MGRTTIPEDILDDLSSRYVMNVPVEDIQTARIFFHIEQAHWSYIDFYRERNPQLPSLGLRAFAGELFAHCPILQPLAKDVDKLYAGFREYKSNVPVYGGIILNEALDKVLLVRGYSSKTWTFPRGKVNKDEPGVACAIREILEEVGYDVSEQIVADEFVQIASGGQALSAQRGGARQCLCTLYYCPGVPEDTVFETRTRKEIGAIAWHPLNFDFFNSTGPRFFGVQSAISDIRRWVKARRKSGSRRANKPVKVLQRPAGGAVQGALPVVQGQPLPAGVAQGVAQEVAQGQPRGIAQGGAHGQPQGQPQVQGIVPAQGMPPAVPSPLPTSTSPWEAFRFDRAAIMAALAL